MADPRNSGKPFERLVELLELLAVAGKARVEYDAHIPDRVTGSMRQIDVAVWFPTHHGEILYAISCKDHKEAVGVTIVEQEAAKEPTSKLTESQSSALAASKARRLKRRDLTT